MNEFDPLASIQRFYDAENAFVTAAPADRDIGVMLKELDPDVVVHVPESLPHGGLWRGHAGFVDLFDLVTEHWSEFEVVYSPAKWNRVDDSRVLTEGRLRAVLRANGKAVDMAVLSIFTFTSRGLSHLDHFYQDTAAILAPAAAGD
ncbi:nuclear transport factor 2 family protein [Sphaerimonospora sp. CA-214678]|uniref:nuclear transport factor 2 family protein n=1 Tax=Sphaerimonospora sp. CA-214678 TaxID=3240029 RepID=UPI003D8E963F